MIKSYKYFTPALLLSLIEIAIGRYLHDTIIRPYGGDFLIVILLYCLVKTFINTPPVKTAVAVLLFAHVMETAQHFHLLNLLRLQHCRVAILLLGTSFSWVDMVCYTTGISLVIVFELMAHHLKSNLKTQPL